MNIEYNDLLEKIKEDYPFEEVNMDLNAVSNLVLTYNDYMNAKRDYGTGDHLSMMEAHVLSNIVDMPGTTVTELSDVWGRTKSAISQTVRKLIRKEYIYRVNSQDDAKVFFLYPNKSAVEFDEAHKRFDNLSMYIMRQKLLENFSKEEIVTFYKVAEQYARIVKEDYEREKQIE